MVRFHKKKIKDPAGLRKPAKTIRKVRKSPISPQRPWSSIPGQLRKVVVMTRIYIYLYRTYANEIQYPRGMNKSVMFSKFILKSLLAKEDYRINLPYYENMERDVYDHFAGVISNVELRECIKILKNQPHSFLRQDEMLQRSSANMTAISNKRLRFSPRQGWVDMVRYRFKPRYTIPEIIKSDLLGYYYSRATGTKFITTVHGRTLYPFQRYKCPHNVVLIPLNEQGLIHWTKRVVDAHNLFNSESTLKMYATGSETIKSKFRDREYYLPGEMYDDLFMQFDDSRVPVPSGLYSLPFITPDVDTHDRVVSQLQNMSLLYQVFSPGELLQDNSGILLHKYLNKISRIIEQKDPNAMVFMFIFSCRSTGQVGIPEQVFFDKRIKQSYDTIDEVSRCLRALGYKGRL